MKINDKTYTVEFNRQLVPVTFHRKGRKVSENRMATTCVLVDNDGGIVDTATVRQYHRDRYSRKAANDAAFRKLANQFGAAERVQMLQYFFDVHPEKA